MIVLQKFNVGIFCITDAEAPTIACSGDQSVNAEKGRSSAEVVWQDPAVADNSGDILQVSCDPKSGSNFTIGQTRVICEVVDESGNRAECFFQINVTGSCFTLFKPWFSGNVVLCTCKFPICETI